MLKPNPTDLPETLGEMRMLLRFIEGRLHDVANIKPRSIAESSDLARQTDGLLNLQERVGWKATQSRARSLSEVRCKLEIWEMVAADMDGAGGELGTALVNSVKRDLDLFSR
ncbi:hypothetical protein [Amaricoccus macauensis]|uniref:hypothetical protein n=1 Tax=Amaricoccus macauensis TaxID=57001 RepID=UPI003C7D321E